MQLRVAMLSAQLPGISKEREAWAYKECLPHLGYANKSSAFCLDCGETFDRSLINRKRAVCPHCHTKMVIEFTRKTTHKEVNYFAITRIVDDFQVVENFELIAYYKKGKPVHHFLHGILEHWILPDGRVTNIGLNHSLSWHCDVWSGDWAIRQESKYRYSNKYDVYARKYHPDSVIKPEYLKYGIDKNLSGLSFLEAIKIVPNEPKAETLIKAKRYDLLGKMEDNNGRCDVYRFWPSIKIVLRNKYKIKDVSMWFDYLELLDYFKKDLHNGKYVCPTNLKKEHDIFMNKKREIERREQAEQDRLRAERRKRETQKAVAEFKKRIKKFLGLQFTSGKIVVKVLESVKEFQQEGDILHHCVFTNAYYSKKDSLILSARIDGVPIETIEVNLEKMKIEQARGYGNHPSEYNKKIISLVKKNLPKIREVMLQKSA